MAVYVDSCVILDLMTDDQEFGDWSEKILTQYRGKGLFANWMVFAEICPPLDDPDQADYILNSLGVEFMPSSRTGLWLASKAFVRYRKSGGTKTSPLPDFIIGAQAEVENLPLITRDVQRYQTYFPNVQLITPDKF